MGRSWASLGALLGHEGAGWIYVPQPPSGNFPGKSILNLPDPPTVWAARPAGKSVDFIFGTHPPPSGETARGIPRLVLVIGFVGLATHPIANRPVSGESARICSPFNFLAGPPLTRGVSGTVDGFQSLWDLRGPSEELMRSLRGAFFGAFSDASESFRVPLESFCEPLRTP